MSPITPQVTNFFRGRAYCSLLHPAPFAHTLDANPRHICEPVSIEARSYDLRFEHTGSWQPIKPHLSESAPDLNRYVDGSAHLTLLAWGREGSGFAALIGGTTGALAGQIVSRKMVPEPAIIANQSSRMVLGLSHYDLSTHEIKALGNELRTANVHLYTRKIPPPGPDEVIGSIPRAHKAARSAALESMREQEQISVQGADGIPPMLTVVDGPLKPHIFDSARRNWPLIGLIKRHKRRRLPDEVADCILRLHEWHRTPAMLLTGEHGPLVTWYVRLAPDYGRELFGVVRVEVTPEYLSRAAGEDVSEWIDDISRQLCEGRTTRETYARRDCSLHAIVLLEDRLHARAGGEDLFWRFHHMLGLRR